MNDQPRPTVDLLSLIGDDKSVVSYRPRWNQLTGSVTATILLQQLIYRWVQSGRRPFYKFTGPCNHPLCRPGDTWEEELGLTRREFETARARIAGRTQGDIADDTLVSYWMTTGHCTWYAINEPLLIQRLADLYPAEAESVGVQMRLPAPKPFHKSANGGNVEWRSTNPPMAMAEMSNGDGGNVERPAEPFNKTANANGGIRQQINRDDLTDYEEQRTPETTPAAAPTPPAADPAPPAAADPLTPILDWLGFDDALTPKERATLDQATLLAWSMWAKLKQAESRGRITNPIGWVRSQWRNGRPVRADLLRLARGWLALDDDGRARLLGRLEWAADYGADPGAPLDALDEEFPDLPLATAAQVFAATSGHLAPPTLSPAAATPRVPPERPAPPAPPADSPTSGEASDLWRNALAELEMQMARATFDQLLRGTTASENGDGLAIHARTPAAAEWLQFRLHPIVQRAVNTAAGRPLAIHYEVRP